MDRLSALYAMVDRLLAGELAFADFDRTFGLYYYENLPVDVMRSSAADLVSAVLEKLEFTTHSPTAHEREVGWIDEHDFVTWLRNERQRNATVG